MRHHIGLCFILSDPSASDRLPRGVQKIKCYPHFFQGARQGVLKPSKKVGKKTPFSRFAQKSQLSFFFSFDLSRSVAPFSLFAFPPGLPGMELPATHNVATNTTGKKKQKGCGS